MDVTKVDHETVQITLNVKECATLTATLHVIGSPVSPFANNQGIRELQPLADALFEAFT
jgi:hypothetical protein